MQYQTTLASRLGSRAARRISGSVSDVVKEAGDGAECGGPMESPSGRRPGQDQRTPIARCACSPDVGRALAASSSCGMWRGQHMHDMGQPGWQRQLQLAAAAMPFCCSLQHAGVLISGCSKDAQTGCGYSDASKHQATAEDCCALALNWASSSPTAAARKARFWAAPRSRSHCPASTLTTVQLCRCSRRRFSSVAPSGCVCWPSSG